MRIRGVRGRVRGSRGVMVVCRWTVLLALQAQVSTVSTKEKSECPNLVKSGLSDERRPTKDTTDKASPGDSPDNGEGDCRLSNTPQLPHEAAGVAALGTGPEVLVSTESS